ncbi:MAG: M20 family metallo-hydrolase [Clostridia bacterium]
MKKLNQIVEELFPSLRTWRRDFHMHAESGWVEYRTASIVAARLTEWGYEVKTGQEVMRAEERMGLPSPSFLAQQEERARSQGAIEEWLPRLSGGFTGVVGIMETGRPGPTIAFRFDLDALDLQESAENDHLPAAKGFSSINPGMMHACGHDGHTTIGLGLAYVLGRLKDELHGTIKLIFQPAEEGVRGAKSMVAAGVVDDVDQFYACHIGLGLPQGEVACGAVGYLSTTKLDVTYTGVAAHAGVQPESGKNAMLAAASAVLNLHAIPRHSSGNSRINVGVLQAGSGRNIIPQQQTYKLEKRGDTNLVNDYILSRAMEIIHGAAAMYGVAAQIEIVGQASRCDPSPEMLPFIRKQAEKVEEITSITETFHTPGSEDATYMMERVQANGGLASYLVLGTTLAAGHHNERFDIDEQVMTIGVKTLALCALCAHER